jgi:molybdate transport system substrate-binding protein
MVGVRAKRFGVAVLLLYVGVSCGSDSGNSSSGSVAGGSPAANGEITVFAAASLTEAFTELEEAFEEEHPAVEVTVNFAGSSDLVAQITDGAPVDVFASADLANMAELVDADGHGAAPVIFATNVAEILVEPGNPAGITDVADLADSDLVVVQCAPALPCGTYAEQVFDNAGVTVTPKSFEANVRAVASKVILGEADAGIVYRTDVIAAGDAASGVAIPDDVNVVAEYPIVATADAANPSAARSFIDFVIGPIGQDILVGHGFGAP